jgi:hypothetical protein
MVNWSMAVTTGGIETYVHEHRSIEIFEGGNLTLAVATNPRRAGMTEVACAM